MSCPDRNQDLLLLTHGELDGIRRALLEHHLRRCPQCRERRRRYGALSSVIAGEVRPREMPAWTPHATGASPSAPSTQRLAQCVALAILLGVAATAGAVWTQGQLSVSGLFGRHSTVPGGVCLPIPPPPAAAVPAANRSAPSVNAPATSCAGSCHGDKQAVPKK